MFSWDETAFIEVLGVLPTITDEYGLDYEFKVTQQDITLVVGANVDNSDCSVVLYTLEIENPIFSAVYLGSPGARVVNDKRGHFIELGAPDSFSGQYDAMQPLSRGLRITIDPHIRVEVFGS